MAENNIGSVNVGRAEAERAIIIRLIASLYDDIVVLSESDSIADSAEHDRKLALYEEARRVFPIILRPLDK